VDNELVADIVRSVGEEIFQGLEPSLAYLKNSGEAEGIDRIVLSGGGACVPGLAAFLAECYGVPSEIANPLAGLDYEMGVFGDEDPEQLSPMLTVSVGLALRKAVER
jgi:type IV pilus assembly protein PilM